MMLPNQTTATTCLSLPSSSSSSSSSEGTPSDYSSETAAIMRKSSRHMNKLKMKTAKETINISPEEDIPINTSYLDQENIVINSDSLDHLTPHLSGDAFMHSNLNSPNHPINKFVNTTFDSPISELIFNEPQMTPVQASPVHVNVSEQVKPSTPIHTEPHTPTPEQQPPTPQPEISTPEPTPESQTSEPIYGPLNKPLDEEELAELVDLVFKAEEQILKDAIDIDDEPRLPPNLSKIQIINLKRKKPEPTIPFDPTKPFFNSASEPNLELLNNAISLRLKRFK
jgi:cell division septation protein DedD